MAVIKQLMDAGINPNIINRQGHKALDLVRDHKIGALIQSYEIKLDNDLLECMVFDMQS